MPIPTRLLLSGLALSLVAAAPLAAQSTAARRGEIPAAITAVKEADLRRDVGEMASPAMRGREGGTIDELRASEWVADRYRKIGLVPMGENGTYFQWFDMTRTRVSAAGSRVQVAGQPLTLFGDLIATNVVPAEASGAVLWVPDARDTTVDVRGRIVATPLLAPAPASIRVNSYTFASRYADAAIATTLGRFTRRGAAAVLMVASAPVDSAFAVVSDARMRGAYDVDRAIPRSANGSDRIAPPPALGTGPTPGFLVRAGMRNMLEQQPQAELSVRLERFTVPSVNVIGMVRGTDPKLRDEYVLYSSHQDANGVRATMEGDSVHAGADDNASVTAADLAAARAFVKQPAKRSILVVNHGSEERGLIGSRWHAAHPVVPLGSIVAVLNGDMIGRNNPDSAALLGSQPPHRNSTDLVEMALRANALTGKFVLDTLWDRPTHPEGWYFRSDHVPYARQNVPSLMYTTNLHDDYHTPRDNPQSIDYPKLERMARWMYLTGWFAANAAERPKVDAGFRLER